MVSISKTGWKCQYGVGFGILLPIMAISVLSLLNSAEKAPSFTPYLMIGSQLAGFFLVAPVLRLRFTRSNVLTLTLWSCLAMMAFASTLWSDYPWLTLQRTLMVFVPAILLTLSVYGDASATITFASVAKGLMYLGTFLAIIGLVIYVFGDMHYDGIQRWQTLSLGPFELRQVVMGRPPFLRISSITGNPNSLAARLAISLIMTAYLHRSRHVARYVSVPAFLLQGVALALTYSRSGIGTTLIMIAGMYVLLGRGMQARVSRAAILMACAVVTLIAVIFLIALPESVRFSLSLSGRDAVWSTAWDAFQESPLGGVGFGVIHETLFGPIGIGISAHNAHLISLAETGIIGYALLMGLWLGALVIGGIKMRGDTACRVQAVTAVVLLGGLLIHQLFEGQVLRYGAMTTIWSYLVAYLTASSPGELRIMSNRVEGT